MFEIENIPKVEFIMNNLDLLEFKPQQFNDARQHLLIDEGEFVDATVITVITWHNSYVALLYLSMCNLMRNTDILKMKKWLILVDDRLYDNVMQVVNLFDLEDFFIVEARDNVHEWYGANINQGFLFKLNKYSFLLSTYKPGSIQTEYVIIQDADLLSSPGSLEIYKESISHLKRHKNDIVMLNEELSVEEYSTPQMIKHRFLDNTLSGSIRTDNEVFGFFERFGISILDFIEHYPIWKNTSFLAFNHTDFTPSDTLIEEFLAKDFHCDETAYLLSAMLQNKTVKTVKELFNIPFSFNLRGLDKYDKFLFSLHGDPTYLSEESYKFIKKQIFTF